jgi:hypothetical protein
VERLYTSMHMECTLIASMLGAARGTLDYRRWCSLLPRRGKESPITSISRV